ncbi:MAG TPA: hypothetical protein PLO62_06275 [Candidatus Hydrogenedentes bacterium]|nr:hypothetical protein [Candidatus Hydrogenedentota bacterium]HOS01951.1 hypothetical protein [Candidatus Hydrogenedentota bacterium]
MKHRPFLLGCCAAMLAIAVFPCESRGESAVFEKGVLWVESSEQDRRLLRKAVKILDDAIQENAQRLPAGNDPIRVILCHSIAEFSRYAGPLALHGVSGIAESEKGIIAVKAPSLIQGPESFAGILRHELFHVLLARNINLANLPHWLNEGICMRYSREYRWETSLRIAQMYVQGEIIPYTDLVLTFDAMRGERAFGNAYAQSLSLTTFLVASMGEESFWAMLHSLDTLSFGDAMRRHLGMGPAPFFDKWRASLWKVAVIASLVSGFGLFQAMALLTLWAYWRKRRRGRRLVEVWDEEDRVLGIDAEEAEAVYEDVWEEEGAIFDDPEEDPDSYQPWEEDGFDAQESERHRQEQEPRRGRPRGHRRSGRRR